MANCWVNGVNYHIEESGTGYPLLFLHGFTGCSSDWSPVISALCTNYRCIAPDLLGHAQTAAPADWMRYSMEHVTDDLLGILDSLQVESAGVIGYSMGGRLALHLACTAPQRVRCLVLEGASPGLATPQERYARLQADDKLAKRIQNDGTAAFVDYWENLPLFASQRELSQAQRARIRQTRQQHSPTGLACCLKGMSTGRQPNLWPMLPYLQVPVLLLAGERDLKFRGIAAEMYESMSSLNLNETTLSVIPQAGHNTHLERLSEYVQAVSAFLATCVR